MAIGFHASHEQLSPASLLEAVQLAESAGFEAAMCSDHFAPWSERQGESGFAWSWLGSALQATSLSFGAVNAPGQRYHPAIIAQALATLGQMYEGRVWVALGSGEALNEHITGEGWPRKELRNQRLLECVEVMRALFDGEVVSHDGLVTVDRAKLWTLPQQKPQLLAAAVSAETARWAGGWADGLATVAQPDDDLTRVIDAYRDGGGAGPLIVQVHVSWAPTDAEALEIAFDQWRNNTFAAPVSWDLETVEAFEVASERVRPEDVAQGVLVSSDPAVHRDTLRRYLDLGFDSVYVHHVGKNQKPFIDTYAQNVLPEFAA
ncbi:putative non-F420 flavinoid oxidoreductase [Microbacteriaceae bacterium SG_E_30_P1]|uniref:Non-F420 flavinoid oxidoreductase n=1 Tax=Antiquaquibacter oligotrophicus TaxID=2880260 RepID=A0ABT6KQH2_9MICO|nr:TIGR03885 family FMN-dependent LLM class oxidoreductase [Antiquaquibacter oligotrophicus]MDH6181449.1 putative non-F420 flavinoid oxidoreductase [Antiquaquibacter oligotrophicus]UDF12860.1 TIGR03885 family FMN-dependent LLM class oxidoreductase [Antiquaquibacter oligotrophicus]